MSHQVYEDIVKSLVNEINSRRLVGDPHVGPSGVYLTLVKLFEDFEDLRIKNRQLASSASSSWEIQKLLAAECERLKALVENHEKQNSDVRNS